MAYDVAHDDQEFFEAFADLLERYPHQKGRYNLRLDHRHFDIGEDEILMESNDPSRRTLAVKVISRAERSANAFPVEWRIRKTDEKLSIVEVQDCCGDPV